MMTSWGMGSVRKKRPQTPYPLVERFGGEAGFRDSLSPTPSVPSPKSLEFCCFQSGRLRVDPSRTGAEGAYLDRYARSWDGRPNPFPNLRPSPQVTMYWSLSTFPPDQSSGVSRL